MLRADYQDFLRHAKDTLANVKNSSAGPAAGQAPIPGLRAAPPPPPGANGGAAPVENFPGSGLKLDHVEQSSSDIVIGMAQNIDPKNFAVFCGSLRRSLVSPS